MKLHPRGESLFCFGNLCAFGKSLRLCHYSPERLLCFASLFFLFFFLFGLFLAEITIVLVLVHTREVDKEVL